MSDGMLTPEQQAFLATIPCEKTRAKVEETLLKSGGNEFKAGFGEHGAAIADMVIQAIEAKMPNTPARVKVNVTEFFTGDKAKIFNGLSRARGKYKGDEPAAPAAE